MNLTEKQRNRNKNLQEFVLAELFLGTVLFFTHYESWVNLMDSTVLAFSYKYGFISRGLVGTFYQWLNQVLPADMMSQRAVVLYTLCVTLVFYGVLLGFFVLCMKRAERVFASEQTKASELIQESMMYICLFFTMFGVPFSAAHFNFGRPDIYCLLLSVVAAILLIKEKAQWLVVPIAALGVMIHQGNVFMYLNIILVLLLYKIMNSTGKRRRTYVTLFILAFFAASALFLWFEFFSHVNGQEIYDEIVSVASQLTKNGKIHEDLVDKEILGIDLTDREAEDHRANFVQFGVFVLLMFPYILLMVRFFRDLIGNARTGADKWKYLFVAAGAGTILPDMLLKIDYGRWMFSIIAYYCVMLLALCAMGDRAVGQAFCRTVERVKRSRVGAAVLLAYPLALQPLEDVNINQLTEKAADWINQVLGLGWW